MICVLSLIYIVDYLLEIRNVNVKKTNHIENEIYLHVCKMFKSYKCIYLYIQLMRLVFSKVSYLF